jgi:hypothetical protein
VTDPVQPPAPTGDRPKGPPGAPGAPSSGRGYADGGPAFVGGIVIGAGLGILLGHLGAWLVIGIGAGFILMVLIAALGTLVTIAVASSETRIGGIVLCWQRSTSHKAVFQAAVLEPENDEISEERFIAPREALWPGSRSGTAGSTWWHARNDGLGRAPRALQQRGIAVRLTDPGQASAAGRPQAGEERPTGRALAGDGAARETPSVRTPCTGQMSRRSVARISSRQHRRSRCRQLDCTSRT